MKKISILLLVSAVSLASCVDKIEAPRPDGLPGAVVVVQGKFLHANPGKVTANVYVTFPLSGNLIQPIGGAKVEMQDDEGRSLPLGAVNPTGTYEQAVFPDNPAFPVVHGRKYRLSVSFPNGLRYLSAWEPLLPPVKADSLSVGFAVKEYLNSNGFAVKDTFAAFAVSTPLRSSPTDEKARFRWEMDQGFRLTDNLGKTCYVVRGLLSDNVFVLGNDVAGGVERLSGFPLAETLVDYRFAEGFYLLAYQQRLSEGAYRYFDELSILLSKKGTLFDPPVGEISSNIFNVNDPEEQVYGYFYATSQDTVRLYVSPQTAGFPKKYCPLPPVQGEAPRPTSCDNCLQERGASTQKPSWWEH